MMKNPSVRLCTLRRWENYPGFGLHLTRTQNGRGMQIGEVEQNSPAAACGLLTGDKVIEINGRNIESEIFLNILQLLQGELKNDTIRFLVTDKEVQGTHIDENYPNIIKSETPKRSFPEKVTNMNEDAAVVASLLSKTQGEPWENIVNNVVQNMNIISPRPAEAKPVNAADLDKEFREALHAQRVNRDQSWYRGNAELERLIIPFKRRNLRATVAAIKKQPGFAGFGMLLSPDPDVGHVISEVLPNSPAERANIRKGDAILQIGDEVVLHYPYKKLVEKLQSVKDDTIYLSIAPKQVILRCALEHIPILTQYDVSKTASVDQLVRDGEMYIPHEVPRPVSPPIPPSPIRDFPSRRSPSPPPPIRDFPPRRSPSPPSPKRDFPPMQPFREPEAEMPKPPPPAPLWQPVKPDIAQPPPEFVHDKVERRPEKDKAFNRDSIPSYVGKRESKAQETYADKIPERPTSMDRPLSKLTSIKDFSTDDHDTKLVVIEDTKPDGSYGFEIEQEAFGSYVIVSVDPNSPAGRSGLKAGDRIMDVENYDATKGSLDDLLDHINKVISHGPLQMIVLTPMKAEEPETPRGRISPAMDYANKRTLVIKKGNNISLGFELKTLEVQGDMDKIHALGNITPGLPADLAGVKEGDRLISVNGTSVEGLSHQEVLGLMKQKTEKLTFVVIDDENVRAAIVSDASRAKSEDLSMREPKAPSEQEAKSGYLTLVLVPNPSTKSLGMRLTPNLLVHAVDSGSAASDAGLKVGDLVVKVDGTDVTPANHQTAFTLLRQGIANGKVTIDIKREAEEMGPEKPPTEIPQAQRETISKDEAAPTPKLVPAMPPPSAAPIQPPRAATGKVCVIKDLQVGKPIGVSIKENKGMPQEITRITPGTPADGLGINPGDLILKINGEDVSKLSFSDVRSRMTESVKKGTLTLEVIDPYSYLETQGNVEQEVGGAGIPEARSGAPSSPVESRREEPESRSIPPTDARSLQISNEGNTDVSLGVRIATHDGHDHYIKHVEPGSLAFHSGLHAGDVIVNINGENVAGDSYKIILEKLIAAINSGLTELLVESKRAADTDFDGKQKTKLNDISSYSENDIADQSAAMKGNFKTSLSEYSVYSFR